MRYAASLYLKGLQSYHMSKLEFRKKIWGLELLPHLGGADWAEQQNISNRIFFRPPYLTFGSFAVTFFFKLNPIFLFLELQMRCSALELLSTWVVQIGLSGRIFFKPPNLIFGSFAVSWATRMNSISFESPDTGPINWKIFWNTVSQNKYHRYMYNMPLGILWLEKKYLKSV